MLYNLYDHKPTSMALINFLSFTIVTMLHSTKLITHILDQLMKRKIVQQEVS